MLFMRNRLLGFGNRFAMQDLFKLLRNGYGCYFTMPEEQVRSVIAVRSGVQPVLEIFSSYIRET
jgi:hypothetical protein